MTASLFVMFMGTFLQFCDLIRNMYLWIKNGTTVGGIIMGVTDLIKIVCEISSEN